jgi:DNA-binding HxlR family transcriptional regulator
VGTYGQYCPIARTAEIFAQRWTPIIVRNLLVGCRTFGELREGAPGIPKALLADRLASLARHGILERVPADSGRAVRYELTQRGRALKPLCDAMGAWGMEWLELQPEHTDPAYVVWATSRLVNTEVLPARRVVVRLELSESAERARYWMLLRPQQAAEVCTAYPGGDENLVVETTAATLARWHLRELTYAQAVRRGLLRVTGEPALVRAWPTWIRPSPHAAN